MTESVGPPFGQRLALALARAQKSRKELAKHLEVSVQSIGQVINGPTLAMTADNCARTAKFLGVSPYWLATGEGEMVEQATSQVRALLSDLNGFEGMLLALFRDLPDDNVRHEAIAEINLLRDKARARAGVAQQSDSGNPYANSGNRRQVSLGHDPERRSATHIDERAIPALSRKRGSQ